MDCYLNRAGRAVKFSACAGVFALLVVSGCGPKHVPVSGTVLLDGKPVKDGYVSFIPSSNSTRTVGLGKVDASGNFRIRDQRGTDGLLPGQYQVAIATGETPGYRDKQGEFHPATYESPAKYGDPKTSGLTATVENKSGQTFEFRLER